jgi:head-tail adaptor
VNVGSLVHEVTIQQGADGIDESGAPIQTWTTLAIAWMAREAEQGGTGERFEGNQEVGAQVTRWTMRYVSDMDPDLVDVPKVRRLLYQIRVYDIIDAQTIDRKNGIILRTLANMGASA